MESSFNLSREELQYFAVAALVTAAGFTAASGTPDIEAAVFYTGIAALALGARELGQRSVAQWMDAYTTFNLSLEGSVVTIFGAFLAVLTGLPVILLFPVFSEFSGKKYEHWGKSIDAIWMKRQYWLAAGGITALLFTAALTELAGFATVSDALMAFTFFQLLPLDHERIPTGALDGAYILRWSGFTWLFFTALTLLGLAL